MIWATVSSWSCFCWLYRASPSLSDKNIINRILVMIIWWGSWVQSSPVLLEEGDRTTAFSWQNSVSLCSTSFCTLSPNLPVTPGISWLPTFACQFPMCFPYSLGASQDLGRDQDHPHGKEMQKSKMAVWEGLTNSCEKKRSKKQRRKDISIWMQSSKEQQGEIRKPSSAISAKK